MSCRILLNGLCALSCTLKKKKKKKALLLKTKFQPWYLSMHCTAGEGEGALLLSPKNCFATDPAIATANSAFHYLK